MPVTDEFVAQMQIMELLEHKSLMSAGYNAVCHMHTSTEEITIMKLLDELDPKTGESKKKLPKFAQVRLRASPPLPFLVVNDDKLFVNRCDKQMQKSLLYDPPPSTSAFFLMTRLSSSLEQVRRGLPL